MCSVVCVCVVCICMQLCTYVYVVCACVLCVCNVSASTKNYNDFLIMTSLCQQKTIMTV